MYSFKAPTNDDISNTENRSADEIATNITDNALNAMRDIAISNDMLIITRPVNSIAFVHMSAGAVGKNMFVHGKSASAGTIAQGLIPMQSSISKAGDFDNVNKIHAYNKENIHSIENSSKVFEEIEGKLKVAAANLMNDGMNEPTPSEILKKASLGMEAFDPLVSKVSLFDKNGNQLYIFEDNEGKALRKKNTRAHIYGIQQDGAFKLVDNNHEIIDHNPSIPAGFTEKKVEVLGKPDITITKEGLLQINEILPITADIDMLSYGVKAEAGKFGSRSYALDLATEKKKLLDESKIALPDSVLNVLLVNKTVAEEVLSGYVPESVDQSLTNETVINYIQSLNPEQEQNFNNLISKFRNAEMRLEHLKGMGEGSELSIGITGHLRDEFKGQMEVSHGPEQFNIYFTQPLDSEWVSIDNKGEVKVIKGEEELLQVFSKAKQDGFNMPPNPNWGWKLENSEYKVDKELRDMHQEAGELNIKLSKANEEEKKQIYDIIESKVALGIASIDEQQDHKIINEKKKELDNKIQTYNYGPIADQLDGPIESKFVNNTKLPIIDLTQAKQPQQDKQELSEHILTPAADTKFSWAAKIKAEREGGKQQTQSRS